MAWANLGVCTGNGWLGWLLHRTDGCDVAVIGTEWNNCSWVCWCVCVCMCVWGVCILSVIENKASLPTSNYFDREECLELILGSHSFVWMQYLWFLCSGRGNSRERNTYWRALFKMKRATLYSLKEICFQLSAAFCCISQPQWDQGLPTCQVLKL